MKSCNQCKIQYPKSTFYFDKSRRDGRSVRCRKCCRANHLKKKYGIAPAEYARLLDEQNHLCAICGISESKTSRSYLSVDHSHQTSLVRGLLCNGCNLAIGGLQDSPRLLEAAAAYLRKYPRYAPAPSLATV
jgi:ribosomal protein L37E